jgi:hypothetical protein
MFELRQRMRFTFQAHQPIAIVAEFRRQDLDRDVSLEAVVFGLEHLSHAAFADLAGDPIPPEA